MTLSDLSDFDRHLLEHERVVYQIAYGVLRNAADAEDVTQDVFLRAFKKLGSLRAPEKFRPWVARMSRRLALNRLRDATRAARRDTAWASLAEGAVDVESVVAEREFHARLRGEIDRLPEKLRTVLLLCAVEEMPTRSVATRLGIPEGTVRSRLHQARKRLVGIAAAVASLGGLLYGIRFAEPPKPPIAASVAALAEWRSPTAALLRSTIDPLLEGRSVEVLGGKHAP